MNILPLMMKLRVEQTDERCTELIREFIQENFNDMDALDTSQVLRTYCQSSRRLLANAPDDEELRQDHLFALTRAIEWAIKAEQPWFATPLLEEAVTLVCETPHDSDYPVREAAWTSLDELAGYYEQTGRRQATIDTLKRSLEYMAQVPKVVNYSLSFLCAPERKGAAITDLKPSPSTIILRIIDLCNQMGRMDVADISRLQRQYWPEFSEELSGKNYDAFYDMVNQMHDWSWTRSYHLKHDPVEDTEEYLNILDELERHLYYRLKDEPHGMGFCFRYWQTKREMLREYHIKWRSPAEMNPDVHFD